MNKIQISVSVNTKVVVKILGIIIASIIILGVLALCIRTFTNYKSALGFVPLFDMDKENSIPTYFSSLNLLISSFLLFSIFLHKDALKDKYRRHWLFLSLIFFFLSIDETASIHEYYSVLIKNLMNFSGPGNYSFAVLGGICVLIFLYFFSTFILSLPAKTRSKFVLAGSLFVSGALGSEAIGGYIIVGDLSNSLNSLFYGVFVIIEESLEMVGVLFFIRAILLYIKESLIQETSTVFEGDSIEVSSTKERLLGIL
ncbi:hypothetical protein [Rufibacter latericius]|uniref:Uncharacterized protein n=1 Tax=Rufibacter latericius TaxID=2487040 RepID=A0A3M9MJL9_9BACT|nr:hypothetical protein [Rufibacter latericius]RNI25749.1 hypothetical protein EFB08_12915 [Rufibacter latericius]